MQVSAATRAKIAAGQRGRTHSIETLAKLSIIAANRKPTWNSKGEVIVDELLTHWGIEHTPQRTLRSPEGYREGDFGIRVDHYLEFGPGLRIVIECNGKFHHADPRLYPDPSKWHFIQRDVVKDYQRKQRLLRSMGIRLIELWELDNSSAEELLVWPLVSELAIATHGLDDLEGLLTSSGAA